MTEALFHLRPVAPKRLLFGRDRRYLKIMRASMRAGIKVIMAEILEFIFKTRFSARSSLKLLPGPETHLPVLSEENQ